MSNPPQRKGWTCGRYSPAQDGLFFPLHGTFNLAIEYTANFCTTEDKILSLPLLQQKINLLKLYI